MAGYLSFNLVNMMKRKAFGCLLLLALLSGPMARGQAPGSRAQIASVPATGETGRFKVPQVTLPDAAVSRRINKFIMRWFRDEVGDPIDSTASPQQQLRQAARQCCFDEDTKTWWAGGTGLTGSGYSILLNQNYLLSLGFSITYNGLEQPGDPHFTFDLRTGKVLKVSDLVANPPGQLGRRFRTAISRRLRNKLGGVVKVYGDDSDRIETVARLYQIEHWDTTPQRGLALDMAGDAPEPTDDFGAGITDFALTPDALLLFHNVGMQRTSFEFLPDPAYTFPWARLQPRERLRPVIEAAAAKSQRRRK